MPRLASPALGLVSRTMAIALFLLAVIAIPEPTHAADNRPNIVWIFVEDMNGWYGCYGDDTVPTPHLDALATSGVKFNRAYMPAGVCSATRSALALGAMQTSFGVHNHRSSRQRVPEEVIHLPADVKTMYQVMREHGYYVISSKGKNDFNFMFDMNDLYDALLSKPMGYAGPDWRKRKEGQPFFAQIQLKGGKNSGKFTGYPQGKTDPANMQISPYYPDVPIIRQEYAHHYDTIRQTDEEVGEIMAGLKADGLLENTVVFFWTDHGMRLYRHKQWLYEGGVRVPLIVAGPGLVAGKVRDDLVSGIDITTTTLALAGIERPSYMEGQDMFADDFHREYVISARDRCDYTIEHVRAVTTPKYRYIRNYLTDRPFMQPQYRDGRPYIEVPRQLHQQGKLTEVQAFWWSDERVPEELYDIENDPHEIHNLADDPQAAAELKRQREILTKWEQQTDDQGQYAESVDSLRGVLKRWGKKCVNPEYAKVRE